MKKQELLGNDNKPELLIICLLIVIIFFASFLISSIEKKFLKSPLTVEKKVIFCFLNTIFIESVALFYIFKRYGAFLKTLFRNPGNLFKGLRTYFIILPLLVIVASLNYSILKLFKKKVVLQEVFYLFMKLKSLPLIMMLVFLSIILAPFFEEILFRGIFYTSLRKKFSPFISILINSSIFSIFHQTISNIMGIFLLGCFLAYLMEKYKNIWASIGLHFFNNFFATVFVLSLKYLNPQINL